MNNPSNRSHFSRRGAILIVLFSLFYCFDYLLQTSISVFLPSIQTTLQLGPAKLGLIGAVFFVSYVTLQVPGGHLLDRYGAKKIGIWMGAFCYLGALAMSLSNHSYPLLILSRLLIGIGSSTAFIATVATIQQHAQKKHFALFIGILQALAGIGAIGGQTPIAILNTYYAWHHIAFIFMGIALLFVMAFVISMKKTGHVKKSHRIKHARVLNIMKNTRIIKLSILSFIAWSPVASLAGFWLIPYLHHTGINSTITSSQLIMSFWLGLIFGAIIIPTVSEWIKRRKPILVIGFLLQSISIITIILSPTHQYQLIIALWTLGFVSPIQGFCIVLLQDKPPEHGFNTASGVINMFGAVSGGFMQFTIGGLVTVLSHSTPHPYQWSFTAYLALSILGFCLCLSSNSESHQELTQRKEQQSEDNTFWKQSSVNDKI